MFISAWQPLGRAAFAGWEEKRDIQHHWFGEAHSVDQANRDVFEDMFGALVGASGGLRLAEQLGGCAFI